MRRKFLKAVSVLAGVAIAFALCFVVFNANRPPPAVPLPNPNGYDDFVKAGQLVSGDSGNYNTMTREQLAGLAAQNREALKLVRTGLTQECRVPVDTSPAGATNRLDVDASLKRVGLALCAEGRLAELEGRTNDAVRAYLDCIRYGNESGRGGVIIDRLVGVACEALAAFPLQLMSGSLDAAESRQVAQTLESIDARAEPLADTLAQEDAWSRTHYSGFRDQFARIFMRKQMKQSIDRAAAKVQTITLQRRRMMVAFAARAYELEKGNPAQNIAELVPMYLKAVPKDPVGRTNLVFESLSSTGK